MYLRIAQIPHTPHSLVNHVLFQYGGADKYPPIRASSNNNFTLSPKQKEEPPPPTRKTYGSGVASMRDKYPSDSIETRMKSPEPPPAEKTKVSRFLQKSQLVNPKSVIERVTFDLAKSENKFPEKKIKMVTRATSPSSPSNSVFLRQRRADLEKVVEFEVTRNRKYVHTRSSSMQTDEHPPAPPPPPPTTVRTSSWNNRFSTSSASTYSPSSSPAPSHYSSNTPNRLSTGYSYARPSDLPIRSSSFKPSDFSKEASPAPRSPRLSSYKSDSPSSPTYSKFSYTRNDSSPIDSKPILAFSYTPRSGDISPKIPEPPPAPLRTVSIGVTIAKPPQSPRSTNGGGNPKTVNIDSPEFREAHMLELSNSISKLNLDQSQNNMKIATTEPSSSSEEEEEDSSYSTEEENNQDEEPEDLFKAHAYSLIHEFAKAADKPPLPSKSDPRSVIVRALAPVAGVKLSEESSNEENQKISRSSSPSYHDASDHSISLQKSKSRSMMSSIKSDSSSSENARQYLNIPQRDIPKSFTLRKFDSCENNGWAASTSPELKRGPSPLTTPDISFGSSSEQEKSTELQQNGQNYNMTRMDSNQNIWWNELKTLQNDSHQGGNKNIEGFRIRKMDSTHEPWWSQEERVDENMNENTFRLRKMDSSSVPWWAEHQTDESDQRQKEANVERANDSDRSTFELNQYYMNRANNSSDSNKGNEALWCPEDSGNYPESGIGETPLGEKCWWLEENTKADKETQDDRDVAKLESYDRVSKKQYLITKIESGERAWWMGQEEATDCQETPCDRKFTLIIFTRFIKDYFRLIQDSKN